MTENFEMRTSEAKFESEARSFFEISENESVDEVQA